MASNRPQTKQSIKRRTLQRGNGLCVSSVWTDKLLSFICRQMGVGERERICWGERGRSMDVPAVGVGCCRPGCCQVGGVV